MEKEKTSLDKKVSDEEFRSKKIHYLNSELQVDLEFNKSLMNLSAGGLVISVTFMQLFMNDGALVFKAFLWTSWILLLASTILCLFFFKLIQNSLRKKHQKLEYMFNTEPPERYDEAFEVINRESIREALGNIQWNEKMRKKLDSILLFFAPHFSFVTSILFVIGVLFLMVFVFFNL